MRRDKELANKISRHNNDIFEEVAHHDGKRMWIGLDFDGTLVEHAWPDIGRTIGAFPHLRFIQEAHPDVSYLLWTMRDGSGLTDAIQICLDHGLCLGAANNHPNQHEWTTSRKIHCHAYVDDMAMGAPLIYPGDGMRPYVDWDVMGPMLHRRVLEYYRKGY